MTRQLAQQGCDSMGLAEHPPASRGTKPMKISYANTFRSLLVFYLYHLPRASCLIVLNAIRNRQLKKESLNSLTALDGRPK